LVVFVFLSLNAPAQNQPVTAGAASAQLYHSGDYDAGKPISVRIKFIKPIPVGASVRVDFGSDTTQQGFSSTESTVGPDRMEVVAKAVVLPTAITGTWQINTVLVIAKGDGAPDGNIPLKDKVHFVVQGHPKIEFPTSADVALIPR
jgi:hypothetical protein